MPRVFEDRVLKNIFRSKWKEIAGTEGDSIMGNFMSCTPQHILL
jgi:hypothetical protein